MSVGYTYTYTDTHTHTLTGVYHVLLSTSLPSRNKDWCFGLVLVHCLLGLYSHRLLDTDGLNVEIDARDRRTLSCRTQDYGAVDEPQDPNATALLDVADAWIKNLLKNGRIRLVNGALVECK